MLTLATLLIGIDETFLKQKKEKTLTLKYRAGVASKRRWNSNTTARRMFGL